MAKNLRSCIICGTKYEYCSNCGKAANTGETWRNIYDTADCRDLFWVCSGYKKKDLSKSEAKARLSKINIPSVLLNEYKDIVNEITYEEPKPFEEVEETPKPTRRKKKAEEIVNVDYD